MARVSRWLGEHRRIAGSSLMKREQRSLGPDYCCPTAVFWQRDLTRFHGGVECWSVVVQRYTDVLSLRLPQTERRLDGDHLDSSRSEGMDEDGAGIDLDVGGTCLAVPLPYYLVGEANRNGSCSSAPAVHVELWTELVGTVLSLSPVVLGQRSVLAGFRPSHYCGH